MSSDIEKIHLWAEGKYDPDPSGDEEWLELCVRLVDEIERRETAMDDYGVVFRDWSTDAVEKLQTQEAEIERLRAEIAELKADLAETAS